MYENSLRSFIEINNTLSVRKYPKSFSMLLQQYTKSSVITQRNAKNPLRLLPTISPVILMPAAARYIILNTFFFVMTDIIIQIGSDTHTKPENVLMFPIVVIKSFCCDLLMTEISANGSMLNSFSTAIKQITLDIIAKNVNISSMYLKFLEIRK